MRPSNFIDLHILTIPTTNQTWLELLKQDLSTEPCTVHLIQGIIGDIGAGRQKGFRRGYSKYVAKIDPDDRLYPGIIQQCTFYLDQNPAIAAVGTYEDHISAEGAISVKADVTKPFNKDNLKDDPNEFHDFIVYRRSFLYRVLDLIQGRTFTHHDHVTNLILSEMFPIAKLPIVGRQWRRHSESHSTQTSRTPLKFYGRSEIRKEVMDELFLFGLSKL